MIGLGMGQECQLRYLSCQDLRKTREGRGRVVRQSINSSVLSKLTAQLWSAIGSSCPGIGR